MGDVGGGLSGLASSSVEGLLMWILQAHPFLHCCDLCLQPCRDRKLDVLSLGLSCQLGPLNL